MIESLQIQGYRSLRDFQVKLGRVTVIAGENGTGKSNLYRALWLLQRMAEGQLAEALAQEGGMPGVLWAGERRRDEPHAVTWRLTHADFDFSLACGISPADAHSLFRTDPDIKQETLRLGGAKGRLMAERKGPAVRFKIGQGAMEMFPLPIHASESIISEVRDGERFPACAAARETLRLWRFYHQFRTDPDSPMRRPQIGSWSPVLRHDGANLAAAWQTIAESRRDDLLDEAVERAFPGSQWRSVNDAGAFQMHLSRPELKRWLSADELSDGTLRYLALVAALLSPKPPPLIVINEPETSLHSGLLAPLAEMIAQVPAETQIVVVTHSELLAQQIVERTGGKVRHLINYQGETRHEGHGGAKRVWIFDD